LFNGDRVNGRLSLAGATIPNPWDRMRVGATLQGTLVTPVAGTQSGRLEAPERSPLVRCRCWALLPPVPLFLSPWPAPVPVDARVLSSLLPAATATEPELPERGGFKRRGPLAGMQWTTGSCTILAAVPRWRRISFLLRDEGARGFDCVPSRAARSTRDRAFVGNCLERTVERR
jgi:hypothetical protein